MKNTTLSVILPFPYRATSETKCDWTSASVDAKKPAVALRDIASNVLSDNEMRRKILTHLPLGHMCDRRQLERNVKDQRNAKFTIEAVVKEIFCAIQKLATSVGNIRADEPTLVTDVLWQLKIEEAILAPRRAE